MPTKFFQTPQSDYSGAANNVKIIYSRIKGKGLSNSEQYKKGEKGRKRKGSE